MYFRYTIDCKPAYTFPLSFYLFPESKTLANYHAVSSNCGQSSKCPRGKALVFPSAGAREACMNGQLQSHSGVLDGVGRRTAAAAAQERRGKNLRGRAAARSRSGIYHCISTVLLKSSSGKPSLSGLSFSLGVSETGFFS
ncbi:hypothetical protein MAPG_00967 [Magnaporthiopsis poae ATCC 64411]|uniref:Uncharacterized protein n=1 Tax=Magnaporthiopsis poae (strain ATCC 64411 / 73-15) TaxID=644358 RepID=A0A0C4DMG0_MAGP6|nr:hypothetical protein MAPG_00967 [Magnaporthiopsis poae ATCC 64411]